MNIKKVLFCISLATIPSLCFSESDEVVRLANINKDYARCLNVTLGNFESDEKAQLAMKKLYVATTVNTKNILGLELDAERRGVTTFLEMLDGNREILLGYMLAKFTEADSEFLNEKKELMETSDYNWEYVNKKLWGTYGCNAVYGTL